ncbi:hypothetical protein JCM17478_30030 [Thermopirellula anaerolimosa]
MKYESRRRKPAVEYDGAAWSRKPAVKPGAQAAAFAIRRRKNLRPRGFWLGAFVGYNGAW